MDNQKNDNKPVKHRKITWKVIYEDFKQRYPNLKKEVTHWRPLEFATIELWLKDGDRMKYDYDMKKAEFIFMAERSDDMSRERIRKENE